MKPKNEWTFITRRNPENFIGGDTLRLKKILSAVGAGTILYISSESEQEYGRADQVNGRHFKLTPKDLIRIPALILHGAPIQVALCYREALSKEIERLNGKVAIHTSRMAVNATKTVRQKSLLELTDYIGGATYQKRNLLENLLSIFTKAGLKELLLKADQKRMAKYEANLVKEFKTTVVISEQEKVKLENNGAPSNKIRVAMHDSGQTPNREILEAKRDFDFVMIGNWNTFPNKVMLKTFMNKTRPKIEMVAGKTKVLIIGPGSTSEIKISPEDKICGVVSDMRNYTQCARFGIATIDNASGVQNKVLDYISGGAIPICSETVLNPLPECIQDLAVIANAGSEDCDIIQAMENHKMLRSRFTRKMEAWDAESLIGNEFKAIYQDISRDFQ